jgi:hypothetical protein
MLRNTTNKRGVGTVLRGQGVGGQGADGAGQEWFEGQKSVDSGLRSLRVGAPSVFQAGGGLGDVPGLKPRLRFCRRRVGNWGWGRWLVWEANDQMSCCMGGDLRVVWCVGPVRVG